MRSRPSADHQVRIARRRSQLVGLGGVLLALLQGACGAEPPPAEPPPALIGNVLRAPAAPVPVAPDGTCTWGQDDWQAHFASWGPVALGLGNTQYSPQEQLDILRGDVAGNGLVALAQQLISARLNLATGAPRVGMDEALLNADGMIGALVVPPRGGDQLPMAATAALTESLAAFNEGRVGPGPCPQQ